MWGTGSQFGPQFYNLGRMSLFASRPAAGTSCLYAGPQMRVGPDHGGAGRAQHHRGRCRCGAGGRIEIDLHSPWCQPPIPGPHWRSPTVCEAEPDAYMAMIETAEIVAERYNVSREAQDALPRSASSAPPMRREAGRLADEIVPITTEKLLRAKDGTETGRETVTVSADEGIRADTTCEALSGAEARVQGRREGQGRPLRHGRKRQPAVRRRRRAGR